MIRACPPAAAVVLVAIASTLACSAASARPEGCPPGSRSDPARSARIATQLAQALAMLAHEPDAAALARRWNPAQPALCFGERNEAREQERVAVLSDALDDVNAAARAAHLLHHHHVTPVWPAQPTPSCAHKVARAMTAERAAHALERAVQRVLGARVAQDADRPGLQAAYAERCRRERAR